MSKQQTNDVRNINIEMKNLLLRSLLTGFIGGLFLGLLWITFSYFNFVEFNPRILFLSKWKTSDWATGLTGNSLTIIIISVVSIFLAGLYYASFKKINSIWIGVLFGFIIWILTLLVIGQIFPHLKVYKLESDTIISTLGLFVIYGTFIGYSISYDFYRIQIDSMFYEDN